MDVSREHQKVMATLDTHVLLKCIYFSLINSMSQTLAGGKYVWLAFIIIIIY